MKYRIEIVQDATTGKWLWEFYDTWDATSPSEVTDPVFSTADEAEAELRKVLSNTPKS